MKKRFNTQHRALAAATLLGLGFIHLQANAQGDIAEIFLEGKLTGPTCTLMAVPKTGGVVTGAANQKIDLGTGNFAVQHDATSHRRTTEAWPTQPATRRPLIGKR
jgi:hypothetical protein